MPYPWQKSSQRTFSEENMDVDTEWIKYSRVSGRASAPKLVMLKTKSATSYIKQSLVLCQETVEKRNGHLENQGKTERSITGERAGEGKRMGKAGECSLSGQAVQCCLPWATLGCSPRTGRWAQVPLELECPTSATWDAKGHPHGLEGMGRLQPVCPERARRALTVCVIRGMEKEVNRLF